MEVEIELHSFISLDLDGVDGQHHAPPVYTRERAAVPILQEFGWSPGPVETDI